MRTAPAVLPRQGSAKSRHGLVLALLATTQFVLVLDITIVIVALPTIQRDLAFKQAELQWLVTGYALTFGGFLLLARRRPGGSGPRQRLRRRRRSRS